MSNDPLGSAAERWARWSLMWSCVSPLVEQQPWFESLDAHTKAHVKEAVTKAALGTSRVPLDLFVMREMLGKGGYMAAPREREERRKAWVEKLAAIADAAREARNV